MIKYREGEKMNRVFHSKRLCRVVSIVLIVVLFVSLSGVSAGALTADEVKAREKALSSSLSSVRGTKDFNGYCGSCTGYQLNRAGIFSSSGGYNGNASYDAYKKSKPLNNIAVTALPASRKGGSNTITSILNDLNNSNTEGKQTYAVFCWHTGTSSAGMKYGHVLLVHAVYNGKVYWGESWGTKCRTASIAQFAKDYAARSNGEYEFDGAVVFGYEAVKEDTSVAGVYRFTKADESRSGPYEANSLVKSFKEGDLITVKAGVTNKYNNVWYKTAEGTYVYSGDVDLHYTTVDTKKQNFTVIGKESKVLAIKIMLDATSYSAPYDGTISGQEFSKEKTVYKINSQVQSVETVKNKHGNIWYKLADGTFLYSGWLKFVSEVKPAVTVTLKAGSAKPGSGSNNTGYPCGKLTKGKNFGLRGVIEASENLKSVLGIIFDVGKFKVAQKVTVAPNAKTLNIQNSNINNKLIFDKLDNGNYVYAVIATTVSGYTATVILSEFSVGTGTYSLKDFADTVFQVAKETGLTVAGSATNAVSALAGSVATACTHPGASWVITKAATALQEGEEQRICPDCKKVLETRKIEKLLCSHEMAEWKVVKAATETEDGQRNLVCPDCEQIVDMEIIPVEKKLLPGDVNEDGAVDGRDVLRLMKYLANEEDPKTGKLIEINEDNADVDGSGSINEKDLLRLVKYLGGEKVTLEPGAMSGNG